MTYLGNKQVNCWFSILWCSSSYSVFLPCGYQGLFKSTWSVPLEFTCLNGKSRGWSFFSLLQRYLSHSFLSSTLPLPKYSVTPHTSSCSGMLHPSPTHTLLSIPSTVHVENYRHSSASSSSYCVYSMCKVRSPALLTFPSLLTPCILPVLFSAIDMFSNALRNFLFSYEKFSLDGYDLGGRILPQLKAIAHKL